MRDLTRDSTGVPGRGDLVLDRRSSFSFFFPWLVIELVASSWTFFFLALSDSFAVFPLVLPFLDERCSAVNGGLGGAPLLRPSFRDDDFFSLFPSPSATSVGSGVTTSTLRIPSSSLSHNDTRLCALEKLGYGRLVLDPRIEDDSERTALPTSGMDRRRGRELVEAEEVEWVEAAESRSLVGVDFFPWDERRRSLCRYCLSRLLFV